MRLSVPHKIVVAAALAQAAACAHVRPIQTTDLIVVGRVETLSAEAMDEWGLNVRFTGRLRVTRALRGTPPSSLLTVRYIAHTDRASDRDFEFHLRRSENDIWLVCNDSGGRGYICR